MKRKLISYELFENIQQSALSTAEHELIEAEPILADILNVDEMSLVCFGADSVMYESSNGSYVHASYNLGKKYIDFKNIEQLVLDENTEIDAAKNHIAEMMDAIIDGNEAKAGEEFKKYLELPVMKRKFNESCCDMGKKKKKKKGSFLAMKKDGKKKDLKDGKSLGFKTKFEKGKKLEEWKILSDNVMSFVKHKEFGPILNESDIGRDERGNVVAVRVPNVSAKNEAKILSFNWKTLDTDIKVLRNGAKSLKENSDFCLSINTLRRNHTTSDDKMQENLEEVVGRWPGVLYLTQSELSVLVGEALETSGTSNFDDKVCDQLAEKILRTAHNAYADRVAKVLSLAGKAGEAEGDAFENFKTSTEGFFAHLDESSTLEMQVYVDLYEAVRTVHALSKSENLRKDAASFLNELAAIIEEQVAPSLDVAVSAAEWLTQLVETNLETGTWDISNNVHTTVNGDHPRMAQNAKKSYTPSTDASGDWGDSAPVSDGKTVGKAGAEEMRSRSWGNLGGEGIWPSLTNPYIPKPFGDYKIKGEKFVDNDSDQLAHSGGSNTWPSLQNPYAPKAETPASYQMNHGKEADLVVNK